MGAWIPFLKESVLLASFVACVPAARNLAGSIVPWSTMVSLANELIDSLTHYLHTFIHPRWCRISEPSTVSMCFVDAFVCSIGANDFPSNRPHQLFFSGSKSCRGNSQLPKLAYVRKFPFDLDLVLLTYLKSLLTLCTWFQQKMSKKQRSNEKWWEQIYASKGGWTSLSIFRMIDSWWHFLRFFLVFFVGHFFEKKHMFEHVHRQIPNANNNQGNITLKSVMTQSRRDGQIRELLDRESRRRKNSHTMAEAGSLLAAPIAVDWKVSRENGGLGLETAIR